MNDPVDRLLMDRARADVGFPGGLLLSLFAHILTVGAAFAAPFVFPPPPPLKVADGFAVVLPRGGGGDPTPPAPAAPANAETQTPPEAPPPVEPPPKVLKPPTEEPKKGLPELNPKKAPKKSEKTPPPRRTPATATTDAKTKPTAGPGGTGASSQTRGFEFGPAGPGAPTGTDEAGDWYAATVIQKVSMIWGQQIRTGMTQPVVVSFTIEMDGSVSDVRLVQSCGIALLDLAAQRAVYNAAPFGPLPNYYGTNRITIPQGIFRPEH